MKHIKADDYMNLASFEVAQFGEKIVMRNNSTQSEHEAIIEKLKAQYDITKVQINQKIDEIKNGILTCNPIQLLSFSADMGLTAMMGATSEFNICADDIPTMRATEYIQSILVSSPKSLLAESEDDPSQTFFSILENIKELHEVIQEFILCLGVKLDELNPAIDKNTKKYMLELQLMYSVRGQRYQVFESQYFEDLLPIHDDVFVELFGLDSSEIINGIKKLQYSLTQGKFDVMNHFHEVWDEYEDKELEAEDFSSPDIQSAHLDFYDKFFGTKLREVCEITKWTDSFVNELSWEQNATPTFFEQEFSGWPIIELPVFKRPFIKIDDISYCFDYFTFVDNFYRAIQKTITRLKPTYPWSDYQKLASEKMVENVFEKLLHGSITYKSNYYPMNSSTKQMAENDLIVIYDDTLFIVEVKAGSFVYTSPINDFNSHIRSYKALIEKADLQCYRTKQYFEKNKTGILYNEDGTEKARIDLSYISSIYTMTVTVDNINALAAKAEKAEFLQLKSHSMSIAVDDLMIYSEYFNSPLLFLHFIKQRSLATQEPMLALNDELDHLGMYIAHNCYPMQADLIPKGGIGHFVGYREELDNYFGKLYHPQLQPKKPLQNIPDLFLKIINLLESRDIPFRSTIANYFLDFALDAKVDLSDKISYVLRRQKQTQNIIPISGSGTGNSLRFTCFVNQEQINVITEAWKREYTLSALHWNNESDRYLIDIYFDTENHLSNIALKLYTPQDIEINEIEKISIMGKELATQRIESYRLSNKTKIGRNQLCSCGSGKKYKKCCGR